MRILSSLLLLVLVCCFFSSCNPDDEKMNTSPDLRLSFRADYRAENPGSDTLKFDTIFTQVGSVTKRIWVYNRDRNAVNIERIELARASGAQYSLIINGQENNALSNIRLRGEDSLLVLVKVSVNPNDKLEPFLIRDSVTFRTNGNLQHVKLMAYGQNAYFHLPGYLKNCNAVWDTLKPHVVYGGVGVARGCTLTIQKGARVFVHSGSGIVVEGTLLVKGTKEHRVRFQGDRIDRRNPYYQDQPGQWYGIVFDSVTTTSVIQYADIKNGVSGIQVSSPQTGQQPDVVLEQCIIKNMALHCLEAYSSDVKAVNCLFSNAGIAAVGTYIGGNYQFNHCTITNYGNNFVHDKPSARFEARTKLSNGQFLEGPLSLGMFNSIIWGSFKDEILFVGGNSGAPQLAVQNNIIRTDIYKDQQDFINNNLVSPAPDYPQFKNPYVVQDYRPDSTSSPALNKGIPAPGFDPVTVDVLGKDRPNPLGNLPDLGAYEVADEQ